MMQEINDFIREMKEPTKEEELAIQEYINSISTPTGINFYKLFDGLDLMPCDTCSNNPKNGGSGICHCILATPVIY